MPGLPVPLLPDPAFSITSITGAEVTDERHEMVVAYRLSRDATLARADLIDSRGVRHTLTQRGNELVLEIDPEFPSGPITFDIGLDQRTFSRDWLVTGYEIRQYALGPEVVSGHGFHHGAGFKTREETFRFPGELDVVTPVEFRQPGELDILPTWPLVERFSASLQASREIELRFSGQRLPAELSLRIRQEDDEAMLLGLFG